MTGTQFVAFMDTNGGLHGRVELHRFSLSLEVEYHVHIRQRYTGDGVYIVSLAIDGEEVMNSVLNSKAEQFYDVEVYVSDPWYAACDGSVSDVKLTNFL